MSLLSKPELLRMAVVTATEFGLDPALICAHIDVRTKWHSGFANPTAISYLTHQSFPDPMESEHRSIQWGLMAIGGEFARSEAYPKPLPDLLNPERNLREGCRLFLRLMEPHSDPVAAAVASLTGWNRENCREIAAATLSKLEAYRVLLAQMPEEQHTFPHADMTLPLDCSQFEGNLLLEIPGTAPTRNQP